MSAHKQLSPVTELFEYFVEITQHGQIVVFSPLWQNCQRSMAIAITISITLTSSLRFHRFSIARLDIDRYILTSTSFLIGSIPTGRCSISTMDFLRHFMSLCSWPHVDRVFTRESRALRTASNKYKPNTRHTHTQIYL